MRPHWDMTDHSLVRRCEDLKRGFKVLYRELLLPELRGAYADLLAAAREADLLIAGELVLAAPLVAEKLRLRWVSVILSPCSFLSTYDPSVLVNVPWLHTLARAGRMVYRTALHAGRLATRHWWWPIEQLRREEGLRLPCDPIFQDKFSTDLVLALFSRALALPQPDWPSVVVQPGFCFFDRVTTPVQELEEFLSAGEPPVVFTLGSTAVQNPGQFYEVSARAMRKLGRRAVLIGAAPEPSNGLNCLALPYAEYAEVFPRAAAVVHQGGSGTVGQALRAGRPMLVVPYGWDQPDNAARVERLGVGLTLARTVYSEETAEQALARLLCEPAFARAAGEIGARVREENAIGAASDAVEAVLA